MKKNNMRLALLIIGLLLFSSFDASGQERDWYDSLIKLLKHGQRTKVGAFGRLDKFSKKDEVQRLAVNNINKHFREVAKLRASGKSEIEIRAYFNSRRKAVGTGSISGMVYESDGQTPFQNYVSVWSFNEYGRYSGYASIGPWDEGAYAITELSTDRYYVRTEAYDLYTNEYYDDVTDWKDATLVPVIDGEETSGIDFTIGSSESEGAISGQVLGPTGIPIDDCPVSAFDEDYNWVNMGATDENGLYQVRGLPSGGYKLQVEYWGSENYVGEWYDDAHSFETAALVTVTAPNTTESINFILGYGGAIEGRVFDSTGKPVGLYDCNIFARDSEGNWADVVYTDENGNFAFSRLATGVYKLEHNYWGQANCLDGWYDGAEDFENATPVAVTAPDVTKDVHITLKAGGAIEGRVFDSTGEPVGIYECEITAFDSEENWISSAPVMENGNFVIPKLKTGVYRLYHAYWGQGNCMDGWYDGAEDFESATPIAVTAPDITEDVHITLPAGGAISGTVLDYKGQPLAFNCYVNAYDEHQNQVGTWGYVGEDGNYTILRLPTGRYKILAEYMGHTATVGEEPVSEWYDGEYEFEDAAFVEVTAPYTTENIDFTLIRGGYIQGRVYGPDGQVLSYSGEVIAYNLRGDQVASQSVLNEGRYFITGLATQDYKLRFHYYGEEGYGHEWYNGKPSFETADSVHVTAPNMTPDINFTLEYPGYLKGFVTDEAGNRLAEGEYSLQIYAYDANTGEYIGFASNSFVGGYQFDLLGGDYKLSAVSFYSDSLPGHRSLAAAYYEHGTSFNDPNTQTISLEAGTTLKLNDLVMEQADGAISGTIYDECNGQPVTEGFYFVFAFDEDGYLAKGSVYSEYNAPLAGEYQLYGLKPGKYYLLAAVGTEDFYGLLFQWYSGIEANIDLETFTPKVTIPVNATAITVSEDLISGVDFNFRLNYKYALIITAGPGGTIEPSPGTHTFCEETEVSIEAIPDTNYGFSHWSGDIPPGYEYDNPLAITVDSDKSITANFVQLKCVLTIDAGTGGTTDPVPGSHPYNTGTQVLVTAVPDSGYQFNGWGGDASGTANPITIKMDSDKSIIATFTVTPTIETGGEDGGVKKGGCFIATAAYGSPLHPHLDILRDFRDTYLLPSKFGRVIVDLYYKYSPFVANLIAKYKVLRVIIRIHLLPFVAFSYLMLHFKTAISTVFLVFIFTLSIFLFVLINKGKRG